jgi:hypothetical protein
LYSTAVNAAKKKQWKAALSNCIIIGIFLFCQDGIAPARKNGGMIAKGDGVRLRSE